MIFCWSRYFPRRAVPDFERDISCCALPQQTYLLKTILTMPITITYRRHSRRRRIVALPPHDRSRAAGGRQLRERGAGGADSGRGGEEHRGAGLAAQHHRLRRVLRQRRLLAHLPRRYSAHVTSCSSAINFQTSIPPLHDKLLQ